MFDSSPLEIFSDRDSIRNQIVEYANQYLELQDFDFSQTSYLSYLIDIISSLTANLIYYNSAVYREFFLTRAMTKEAVLNLSSMLGYSPKLATPSTGSVLISMPVTFSSDVSFSISAGFQYKADTIIFEQIGDIDVSIINPNTDYVTCVIKETQETGGQTVLPYQLSDDNKTVYFFASVKQQETQEFEFVIPELNPYEFYSYQLTYDGSLSDLTVGTTQSDTLTTSETWTQYDSLFLIPTDTRGFAFRSNLSGGKIFFGNGVIGLQPTEGRSCTITIATSQGASGNVIAGSITDCDTIYITDIVNGVEKVKPIKMTVINTSPTSGGADAPTIDEIKTLAMANVSSAKRLTSSQDFTNIKSIVEDLPIEHAIHILKRSDLKQNEICLFTDLIFDNYIVPMRSASWSLTTTDSSPNIYSGTDITIDDVVYETLFDMYLDLSLKTIQYYYIMDNVNIELTTSTVYVDSPVVLPIYANFSVVRNTDSREDDIIQMSLYYQKVVDDDYSTSLTAMYIVDWSGEQLTMTHFPDDAKFVVNMYVRNILSDDQLFKFKLIYNSSDYVDCNCTTTLKRDLSEYMSSQIQVGYDGTSTYTCKIIDVPVIQKDYYDSIDSNTFKLDILNKIVSFDVTSYRMLTDFVNLKFSNTTGKMNNMLYNSIDYTVKGINPSAIPSSPEHTDRYLITDKFNPWDVDPPFFAVWSDTASKWVTTSITPNSMIYDEETTTIYVFNGEVAVYPVYDIPFTVKAVVWRTTDSSYTSQVMVTNIKDTIIDTMYSKFGYDQPIYRSEIIAAIQSVDGVSHCRLIYPESDIFFTYSGNIYENFTQTQLLEYSPDLVYTDTSNIDIEIR